MRLIELRLSNFRQFEGEHTLQLAPEGERNVTVVYAANGSGKTTILNAFTWCLYGKVSQDFMFPDRLISDGVWSLLPVGETAKASVTLEFEHNGEEFTLVRNVRSAKIAAEDDQKPTVEARLIRRTLDGAQEIENPRDFVDTVLPERLHHFFFLNGERFEHLLSAEAFTDIDSAIKTLLGIELIERGIKHLKETERKLNAAYRKLGNAEEAGILDRLARAQALAEKLDSQLSDNMRNERRLSDEIAAKDERLRVLAGSRGLQQERDSLTAHYSALDAQRITYWDRRLELLSAKGFLPFVLDAANATRDRYADMRAKREIPRPIKLQFVEDLLEHGECVCGTDISQPGAARSRIEEWRQRAGRPELEEAWTRLGARISDWESSHTLDLEHLLRDLDAEMARMAGEMNSAKQRLSELSRELEEADEEDIRLLESSRSALGRKRDDLLRADGELNRELRGAKIDIQSAEGALRAAKAASAEAEIASRRLVAAEDVRRALEKMLELRTNDVRLELDKRVKAVYGKVVRKKQIPGLSRDFDLTLQEDVDGRMVPKAMGTGEAQVLTLSFVGALADLARETYETSRTVGGNPLVSVTGGIFPFVADAIFGTLDENFRREVSKLLPGLAPQVVLFLSKAQSAGDVRRELEPRIGAAYVIDARMARTDIASEVMVVNGREYPYVTIEGGHSDHSVLVSVVDAGVGA